MFLRLAVVLALIYACSPAAFGQSAVVIDGDLRVFTTVAALNVAGFDAELGAQYHPARVAIRKIGETLDPDLVQRLKAFYQSHKGDRTDEEQLSKYVSLAVVLTDPPEFKPITREEGLSDAAREVLGFTELLREFYQKARISQKWAELQPQYDAEMDRIAEPIRDAVLVTDSYLRVALGGPATETMRITVELAAPRNSVNLRSHQDNYFVVLGYSAETRIDEVRHAYLHLRLNNLAAAYVPKVSRRDQLMPLIANEPGVAREHVTDFYTMMTESLIRALELRVDSVPAARAQEPLRRHYRSGLLLAPYFYDALLRYEATDEPLSQELGRIAEAVDIGKEIERFRTTFHTIPLPDSQPARTEASPPPRIDPVADLLRTAENALEKDKPRAKDTFNRVLKEHDANNGRALYGLGVIALDQTDLEEAYRYFDLTTKSSSADASRRTWAHIYLGRILDFRCDRAAAVENYRKAVSMGDNTQGAQSKAEEGLTRPYGGGCQQ
jgi:tetratricopeptide (TPR) repeat protein